MLMLRGGAVGLLRGISSAVVKGCIVGQAYKCNDLSHVQTLTPRLCLFSQNGEF